MMRGLRAGGIMCVLLVVVGCGDSRTTMDTRTYYGAFNMIASEVENLNSQVNFDTYYGQDSPVEDQLGSAIHKFLTNEDVKGTELEAEVQKLADLETKIMDIWRSPDGSVEKIRAAAKEMQDQVEHIRTMI